MTTCSFARARGAGESMGEHLASMRVSTRMRCSRCGGSSRIPAATNERTSVGVDPHHPPPPGSRFSDLSQTGSQPLLAVRVVSCGRGKRGQWHVVRGPWSVAVHSCIVFGADGAIQVELPYMAATSRTKRHLVAAPTRDRGEALWSPLRTRDGAKPPHFSGFNWVAISVECRSPAWHLDHVILSSCPCHTARCRLTLCACCW